jgi:phytoene dehydrogenase-like protein
LYKICVAPLFDLQAASFLHMHLGIDATGLSPDLDCHHLVVNDWSDLEAPLNVCIASIPTQFDPALAPPGKAVVHAYTAGNEPYSVWEGLKKGSKEYEDMKQERSQTLWKVSVVENLGLRHA